MAEQLTVDLERFSGPISLYTYLESFAEVTNDVIQLPYGDSTADDTAWTQKGASEMVTAQVWYTLFQLSSALLKIEI